MERRSFLAGMLAAAAAPAVIKAGVLMPVYVPRPRFQYAFNFSRFGTIVGVFVAEGRSGGRFVAAHKFDHHHHAIPGDCFNVRFPLGRGQPSEWGSWNVGPDQQMVLTRDPLAGVHAADVRHWPFEKA